MSMVSFPLSLMLSGVIGALLAVTAGQSLGIGGHGGGPRPPREAGGRGCVSFFVGAQSPGEIHLHLANDGREAITARLELVDEIGDRRAAGSYSLRPHATHVVSMRRPPAGTGLKVSAGSRDLRAHAEIAFDDGSEPESYLPGGCA
jgi:hypothetical protein